MQVPKTYHKPFLVYVGGKTQLLYKIIRIIPDEFNTYIEPFIGGGSVFLCVQPKRAIINDINPEIVNVYETIRTDVYGMMRAFNAIPPPMSRDAYNELRSVSPFSLSYIERAARTIYLNKTCYRGRYQQNKRGEYVTPFNCEIENKDKIVIDRMRMIKISEFLQNNYIEIHNMHYRFILDKAKEGDFVYLDPPYDKETDSSFTRYYFEDFSQDDQIELATRFTALTKNGVKILHSNANTPFIRELYKDFEIINITVPNTIMSKKRVEVLIKNY